MTGSGQSATDGDRGLEAEDLGAGRSGPGGHRRAGVAVAGVGRPDQPGHGHQVEPDAEVRPSGRDHHGPDLRVGPDGGHGPGQIGPEGRAQGVALLRSVEPQGGHVPVDLDGEHLGGEGVDGWDRMAGSWSERRPPVPLEASRPAPPVSLGSGARAPTGSMGARLVDPGLLPREAVCPVHLHPRICRRPARAALAAAAPVGRGRGVLLVPLAHREGRGLAVQPDRPARPRPVPSGRAPSPAMPSQRSRALRLGPGPLPGRQPGSPFRADGDHQRCAGHRGLVGR